MESRNLFSANVRKRVESQREATLEALRESKERYSAIFDQSPIAIEFYDSAGSLIHVNSACINLFGVANIDEIPGFKLFEDPNISEDIKTKLLNRENVRFEAEFNFEEVKRLNLYQTTRSGIRILDWSIAPLTNGDLVIGYILQIQDITERKEIEAGLEKTRKELAATKISEDAAREYAESIINTVREPLIALNQDLRVVSASRSFYDFFKVVPENTVGQLIYDLGNKQWDIPKLRELLETILPQKTTFDNYEVEHIFATVGRRIMLLNARQIQRALGNERVILLAIEDITERKRAEDKLRGVQTELERSNTDLEQFASIASHDLQEPLRMVASYTQLLAERYEGQLDEKAGKYIAYAVEGAIRMQRLVNDLLTYSRVSTRGNPLETTDSHSILGQAISNLAAMIEESKAIVTNEELPMVRADASQLVQVFQNLLANAIKFRGENFPRVHVSARDEGREWVFSVRDNGIGIDRQYAERVFVIFQRLHTRQEYPGTGIGLAVCKRIVERHGGRIWFESEPGKGSTFFFTVPK
ncbi:PAS domain S-box protein [bacterium]|nr:MAG: PAS domain S-box protein [bacterium]